MSDKYQVVVFCPGRRVFARGVTSTANAEALAMLAIEKGYHDPQIVVERPRRPRKA